MVKEFCKNDFEKYLKEQNIIVLYFYATWCGPCVSFKPIFEKVSDEFKDVNFIKINVDEQRDIAIKYSISAIPTIIFIKNEVPILSNTGVMSEDSLKNKINEILK